MNDVFFTAKKIWIDTDVTLNVYADFVENFRLEKMPRTAIVRISADSNYLLLINGKAVGSMQYGDFPEFKVYDTYDVLDYLELGDNTLTVIGYYQGESSFSYKLGDAGVIYALFADGEVVCQSDEHTKCRINPNYQSGEVERITSQLSFSFRYNSIPNDIPYQRAQVKRCYDKFVARPIKKLEVLPRQKAFVSAQGAFLKPYDDTLPAGEWMQKSPFVALSKQEMGFNIEQMYLPNENGINISSNIGDGIYFMVDLLEETAGFLTFEIDLPCETDIYVGFGETITSLRVRTSMDGRQFAAVYRGKKGKNKFTHRFRRIAGRYLQIQILAQTATVYYAGILPTEYMVEDKGKFVCDDTLHNKIYEVSKRTLQLCMHEHYEDCPWREQALYALDSRIEMLATYYTFGDTNFVKENLRLFVLNQRENGILEMCAPAECPIYIPVFTLNFVCAVAEYLKFSGDIEFVKEIFPNVNKIIETFSAKMTENNLLSPFSEEAAWNFYEWSSGFDGDNGVWGTVNDYAPNKYEVGVLSAPLNANFSLALTAFAEICKRLQKPYEEYIELKEKINKALSDRFWDDEKLLFCSFVDKGEKKHYAELTQSLLICCGAATKEQEENAVKYLTGEKSGIVETKLGNAFFRYEALLKTSKENAKFVFSDIAKRWGDMLFAGATSFWEDFDCERDPRFIGAGSLCHGWAALPIYFYYAYALGIKPDSDQRIPLDSGIPGVRQKQ